MKGQREKKGDSLKGEEEEKKKKQIKQDQEIEQEGNTQRDARFPISTR